MIFFGKISLGPNFSGIFSNFGNIHRKILNIRAIVALFWKSTYYFAHSFEYGPGMGSNKCNGTPASVFNHLGRDLRLLG
jgi:hypothetical protein